MAEVDDRISELPDEIVNHIISFLPTEDAIDTREISKRWRPLWFLNPSPNLDIDDQRFYKKRGSYSSFKDMVNVAIYTRRVHQPIKSFLLRCHDKNSMNIFDVAMWLIDAAERGMEYLDVHFSDMSDKWHFHCCVFNFRNLVVLKLKGINMSIFVSTQLPSLRTLHLNEVYFFEHGFIVEILKNCPILEDLVAKNVTIRYFSDEYDEEVKSLPNLVRADICNLSAYDVHLEAFYNVEFLRIEEMFGCIPVFSNLTHLEIVYGNSINWYFILGVLENCPKLEVFLLNMPLTPNVFHFLLLPNTLPLPKCLSLKFKRFTVTNFRGKKHELQFVQNILLISTSLESMKIYSSPSLNSEEKIGMLEELLAFPKSSDTCEVYFE